MALTQKAKMIKVSSPILAMVSVAAIILITSTTVTDRAVVSAYEVSASRSTKITASAGRRQGNVRSSQSHRKERDLSQTGKGSNRGKGGKGSNTYSDGSGSQSDFDGWLDGLYCGCLCSESSVDGRTNNAGVDCDYEISTAGTTTTTTSSSAAAAANSDQRNQTSTNGEKAQQEEGQQGVNSGEAKNYNNNVVVVSSSTYVDSSVADPYTAFDIATCNSYSHLWTYDLLTSCGSGNGNGQVTTCQCTFAQELMYRGLLSCSDARHCPNDCPVCSDCLNLLCGSSTSSGRIAASVGGSGAAIPIAAMALTLLCGASYIAIRRMNQKGNGSLGESLVEMKNHENWLVKVNDDGLPEERGSSFKPVWLAPQHQIQHDDTTAQLTNNPRSSPNGFVGRFITLDNEASQEENPFPDILKGDETTSRTAKTPSLNAKSHETFENLGDRFISRASRKTSGHTDVVNDVSLIPTSERRDQQLHREEHVDELHNKSDDDDDTDIVSSVSGSEQNVESVVSSISFSMRNSSAPRSSMNHHQCHQEQLQQEHDEHHERHEHREQQCHNLHDDHLLRSSQHGRLTAVYRLSVDGRRILEQTMISGNEDGVEY